MLVYASTTTCVDAIFQIEGCSPSQPRVVQPVILFIRRDHQVPRLAELRDAQHRAMRRQRGQRDAAMRREQAHHLQRERLRQAARSSIRQCHPTRARPSPPTRRRRGANDADDARAFDAVDLAAQQQQLDAGVDDRGDRRAERQSSIAQHAHQRDVEHDVDDDRAGATPSPGSGCGRAHRTSATRCGRPNSRRRPIA